VEPIVEQIVEPIVEPIVEQIVEPIVEPIVEQIVEPIVEPIMEPIEEQNGEQIKEQIVEPIIKEQNEEVLTKPAEKHVSIPIKISSIKMEFSWGFDGADFSDNNCGLCKRQIYAPTINNINKGIIDVECVKGKCGHFFHADCMCVLVKNKQFSCPIDNTLWQYDGKISTKSVWK
jgi:hypothetical protein